MKSRVRFAPSPTGALHIGGLRTALYNYLFAKKSGGEFIVRIEDTDSERFVPGAEDYIMESLRWCGLTPDEGVGVGGPHAPYRQSERKAIYKQYADELLQKGMAYYAFDMAQTLEQYRKEAESKGEAFSYNHVVRRELINSLTLSEEETKSKIDSGEPYVIRFKTPENEVVEMDDIIRGKMKVNSSVLDDKVLYKSSDGLPTYHLANIVDDHLMEITHVIRGEEWLPSLPLHYLLYMAFGWGKTMPQFAHLPLLLKPQGQGKLSKRDGDKFGFPIFPLQWTDPKTGEISKGYREEGYFPEAVINMLSLLGWNPGTEQEMFSLEELSLAFSLEKVNKSGSRFNPDKSKWFNAQYMKLKKDEEIGNLILNDLQSTFPSASLDLKKASQIVSLFKDRVNFPAEIVELSHLLFDSPNVKLDASTQKLLVPENVTALADVLDFIKSRWGMICKNELNAEEMEKETLAYIKSKQYHIGQIMGLFRLMLIGKAQGPNVFPICAFIGIEEVEKRLSVS